MSNDRTQTDRQRETVNAILESRARVKDASDTMADALARAAQILIHAASLDTEYSGALDTAHASAPTASAPTAVEFIGACGARVVDGICTVTYLGDCSSCMHNVKPKRKRKSTASTQAHALAPTHASTFADVATVAPSTRPALPMLAMPAPKPYMGTDATSKVYTDILRALSRDTVGPTVHARVNWHASIIRGGIVRVSVNLANVQVDNAHVGQGDMVWGKALSTTIRPNPSKTAKRRRVTYAPLTDELDWAFYLVTPTAKAKGDAWAMPSASHLRKGATTEDLRQQVDASNNWRLSVKGSVLRVDCALPAYANVVPVKRSPTWGRCIATTRHPGARRIAKTITLGPCLVLMLDVIERVKARVG